MRILAIETSCDETAVAVVESSGVAPTIKVRVMGHALYSQAELHAKYGGVFPSLAKREHGNNLAPLCKVALSEAQLWNNESRPLSESLKKELSDLLSREGALAEGTLELLSHTAPPIDALAVTHGPGLEPALWVGVNFAKALARGWNIPVIPVNHMEAHLLSSLVRDGTIGPVMLPALALLISGGHTEFVLMSAWGEYEKLGETLDDAVGEAFDKVARLLELPYPGGPQIARLAEEARIKNITLEKKLPRPMLGSNDLNFSFSGLKTAVLYRVKEMGALTEEGRMAVAREFEDAVAEVLVAKTRAALMHTDAHTVVLGGGVAANRTIRSRIKELMKKDCPEVELYLPDPSITGDNAVMIGIAGLLAPSEKKTDGSTLAAQANLTF